MRRTDFQSANTYTGQKMKGPVDVSYKIDGVRMLYRDGKYVTRNDLTPPGFAVAVAPVAMMKIKEYGDVEVYSGKFHDISGTLNRHGPDPNCITSDMIYPLNGVTLEYDRPAWYEHLHEGMYDKRLHLGIYDTPSEDLINVLLRSSLAKGYEGLVLRHGNRWYRVKPYYTADVLVTGYFEQLDKNKKPKGVLGGFDTAYGKVTAFSDEKRVELWENPGRYIGRMIEVVYRELYDSGSFRYCVKFVRFRNDKANESFDTKNYTP